MKLGEPDESGRRRPVPINGSEFAMPVELVVLAIGQVPDTKSLDPDDRITMTRDQRIQVNRVTFATNRPGVFATGDAVTRDKMSAIEAIGMGKKAAVEIDAYLSGKATGADSADVSEIAVARREMSDTELLPKPGIPVPKLSMEKRLTRHYAKSYSQTESVPPDLARYSQETPCLAVSNEVSIVIPCAACCTPTTCDNNLRALLILASMERGIRPD